jgi:hypothetical protein
VSYTSSVFWPNVLTSYPPQLSSTADVASQDTRDPSIASPLPHTKPEAHAVTQNTYVANQNNICPNPAQEDIVDVSFSSTPGPYHANDVSRPPFHCCIA